MYSVYIGKIDFICCGSTTIHLFVDAVLYSEIDIHYGSLILQKSLDRLANWADEWQVTMNINKCVVMLLFTKPQPTLHAYFIDGIAISHLNFHTDVGITISSNLSFEQHMKKTVSKAQQHMSILL